MNGTRIERGGNAYEISRFVLNRQQGMPVTLGGQPWIWILAAAVEPERTLRIPRPSFNSRNTRARLSKVQVFTLGGTVLAWLPSRATDSYNRYHRLLCLVSSMPGIMSISGTSAKYFER